MVLSSIKKVSRLSQRLNYYRRSKFSDRVLFGESLKRWMGLSLLIGIIVGLVMTIFMVFLILLTRFFLLVSFNLPIISMAIGGAILTLILYLGIDTSSDNGISHAISQKHKGLTVSMSTGIRKFFTAGVSIASGLPVGREAPALLLGSSIASRLSEAFKVEKQEIHNAMTLGGAAATGALFQAPFGSAVFAAEVPYKEDADEPMMIPAFVASVAGAVTLSTLVTFLGNWMTVEVEIFEIGTAVFEINAYTTVLAASLGLLSGLVGRGFVDIYRLFDKYFQGGTAKLRFLLAGLSISLSSIILASILYPEDYLGEGNTPLITTMSILDAGKYTIWIIIATIIFQMLATAALLGSGFQGGIFGPSLRLGILTGLLFGLVIGTTELQVLTSWAIIGMSGVHAATTKTPIASILLILEITLFPPLVIPMIIANVMAYMISGSDSLYQGQVRSRDSHLMQQLAHFDHTEGFLVKEVMTKEVVVAHPEMTVGEMRQLVISSSKRDFPVIVSNEVVGMISIEELSRIDKKFDTTQIAEYFQREFVRLGEDMTGKDALRIMLDADVERAVVTDDMNQLMGILSINDIVRGHNKIYDIARIKGE